MWYVLLHNYQLVTPSHWTLISQQEEQVAWYHQNSTLFLQANANSFSLDSIICSMCRDHALSKSWPRQNWMKLVRKHVYVAWC